MNVTFLHNIKIHLFWLPISCIGGGWGFNLYKPVFPCFVSEISHRPKLKHNSKGNIINELYNYLLSLLLTAYRNLWSSQRQ